MGRVEFIVELDDSWIRSSRGGCVVQPVAGLNIVLSTGRAGAARGAAAEWRSAQALEEIIWGPVLLDDHDYVLKTRDLGVCEDGS